MTGAQEKFSRYAALLREWQPRVNLVSRGALNELETRHFADSAQLAGHVPKDALVIDLGSGAGFPGAVLAVLGYQVACIESISKKAAFLSELKKELDLPNLTVVNDRIENVLQNLTNQSTRPIVFTARAFAPLDKILDTVKSVPKSRLFLLKGRQIMNEISMAKGRHKFDYALSPSMTGDGFIVEINVKN
jgi:16S rRNA (guanine527-N7)-methyltransferase